MGATKIREEQLESTLKVRVGTITVTGNGTYTISGLDFAPKSALFVTTLGTADYQSSTSNGGAGIGMQDKDGNMYLYAFSTRHTHGSGVDHQSNRSIGATTIGINGGSQNNVFYGLVSSWNSDGITITIDDYAADGVVMYQLFG